MQVKSQKKAEIQRSIIAHIWQAAIESRLRLRGNESKDLEQREAHSFSVESARADPLQSHVGA